MRQGRLSKEIAMEFKNTEHPLQEILENHDCHRGPDSSCQCEEIIRDIEAGK